VKKDEEIRHEREAVMEIESVRKALEQQLKDLQVKNEEIEENARKEARRIAAKYEARVNITANHLYVVNRKQLCDMYIAYFV
jgi:hypothetical protein